MPHLGPGVYFKYTYICLVSETGFPTIDWNRPGRRFIYFFLFFSGINLDRNRIIRFQSLNDRDSAGHLHSINLRKFPGGRYNTCHFNFSGKIALATQYV